MQHYTNEILNDNDRVFKELKPIREEQKAIDENYRTLDERMDKVETFAEEAAKVVGVEFTKG